MSHVVLKDDNGHTAVFGINSFLDQLAGPFPVLTGVELSAVAMLRRGIKTDNNEPVIAEHVERLVNMANAQPADIPVVNDVVPVDRFDEAS